MINFRDAIKDWMVKYKRNSIKPSSYDRLETSFKLMEQHKIAWVTIDQIDTDYIQEYLNDLVSEGYAMSTIKKQFHLITAFMDHANVIGLIERPFHKAVNLPSRTVIKKETKEVIAYSEEEQKKLLKSLDSLERPSYAAVILMLETGMRIGEVLALGWSDINWQRRCVRIWKTFVRLGNHRKSYIQKDAKSYSSNRTIPLSNRAIRILNTLKAKNDISSEFIIHDDDGDPLCYEAMRWQISQVCKSIDIPYYGMHAFRHTFATNCYYKGCDVKKLSKLLGHSNVTITYNIYIHLFGDELEEMRLIVD
jgi:integrase